MGRKSWWIAGLVVVLAAGSWGGYKVYGKKGKQLAATYSTTVVRKGTIEVKVSGTGSIQPSARETLKAKTAGTALKVNFKKGDTVKKGDVLITYKEEDISSQVQSKNIDLKKKKLDLADLQSKYKEASDDSARATLALNIQKQQLDIAMAEEDLTTLRTSKKIDPIVAPIDGVLSTFNVAEGDSLNPNADIGEVVNFAQLQMVVGIDELDIPKVKLGQEAQILVEALPKKTFNGKVVTIADEGTTSNGVASFDVTVLLDSKDDLKVGMSAEASIMTAQKADALYVPVEAVQSSQGKYFVMVPAAGSTTSATGKTGQAGTNGQAGQGQWQGGQGQAGQSQAGQSQAGQSQAGQSQAGQGAQGQGNTGNNSSRFQNMTEEERAAMREQFMAARGNTAGGTSGNAGVAVTSTTRVEVTVGINNEDSIEILTGLKEGDLVVLPTIKSTSSNANAQAGFGGFGGGFPGAGGGFQGGAGGAFGGGNGSRQTTTSKSGTTGGGR
ncbi:efflux RND transporter periplasmic adaptor subunit [Cohnella endophytica]|uniref:Efflux RND transporter periplasmic adaptor subunit n=1 Tax=Cohnella endophytica TaxID=2419778 RepID=A0A494Y8C0_9BACL|nr:efflux RND transporter periplasmic adaptor subunit [Cohnella endophytica]RKP56873.1 efflux RND transporter periplasmic adaptor subunit [Cohnella endophytica]